MREAKLSVATILLIVVVLFSIRYGQSTAQAQAAEPVAQKPHLVVKDGECGVFRVRIDHHTLYYIKCGSDPIRPGPSVVRH